MLTITFRTDTLPLNAAGHAAHTPTDAAARCLEAIARLLRDRRTSGAINDASGAVIGAWSLVDYREG